MDITLKHKKTSIVPFNFSPELYTLIIKHRHITGIPTVAHLRRLLQKDIKDNPFNYGLSVT